jgi:hypothetical protein
LAFITSILAATLGVANISCAETFNDLGVTHYLHHKLGIHDYLHGPGGLIPRMTGLPEQVPTQHKVSLLHGTYPVGPYRRHVYSQNTVPQNRLAQRTTPARTIRFDEFNLSVTTPSGPWVKIDPKKTGSHACLLLTRTNPTIMISLAGEKVGIQADDTNASLLAAAQTKMLKLPGATIEPGDHEQSAGGIPGAAFTATVGDEQSTLYYSLWVAAHHGFTYKLAVYGDQQDTAAIDAAMQNVLTGLKQIQSNRIARVGSEKKAVTR